MRLKTLLSWSSGKDSAWSLYELRRDPDIEVVGLVTTINSAADRVAMHAVGRDTTALAREMIEGGLRARLTCVDPRVLDARFAGREFDKALLAELPATCDPCGEHGEFHTFAYAGPMFTAPIAVTTGVVVERDGFVFADLWSAATPVAALGR